MSEANHESAGVRRAESQGRRILVLAGIVLLRSDDHVAKARFLIGQERVEDPPERKEKIVGRHGRAVGPAPIGPQMKGIGQAVGRGFPTLSRSRKDAMAIGSQRHEAFKQRAKYHLGIAADVGVRIQIGGL